MKKLLCESNPMCYGSSTVLLSIIEQLYSETVCLAFGVAKEILKGSTEIIEVNNKSSTDVNSVIANIDFDSVLVVSNTSNLALYKSLNKKIYFVHIHLFYPSAYTEIFESIDVLFAQNFWGIQQLKSAIIVGPLIKSPKHKRKNKDLILVNLGGGESTFIKPGINSNYGELMLNLIIQLKPFILNKNLIFCGGNLIIESIKDIAFKKSIKALSLSNDEYLDLLDQAEFLFSSPGLNSIFEAIFREIPIVFLPPQNISQIYQLDKYEEAGLAVRGLNLPLPCSKMTEEEQTTIFLKEMALKYNQNVIKNKQKYCVMKQLKYTQTREFKDQIALAQKFLGKIGTSHISNIINSYNG